MISQSDNREDETQVPNMFLEINNTYCWTVSTGIKKFDDLLKGGFLRGAVSQVFGEAGTGKSQFAMQLALGASVQNNKSVIISTDKMLHLQRFEQLQSHYQSEYKIELKKHWTIYQCDPTTSFLDAFEAFEAQPQCDILIIDNVYRVITDKMAQQQEIGKGDMYNKARVQRVFVNRLREIAKKRKLAVVLINNASAVINDNKYTKNEVKAALSTSWDNEMDENIQLTKKDHMRKMKVLFSVKAPVQEISFTIENNKGFSFLL